MTEQQVFVSHANADSEVAKQLQRALAHLGIDAITLGEQSMDHTDLAIEIQSAIRDSYAVALLVSASSLQSPAIDEDMEFAESLPDKPILPISIDGTGVPQQYRERSAFMEGPLNIPRVAEILYEMRPQSWSKETEPQIYFPPDIKPAEVVSTLAALAAYWRNCGGIGLPVEFEMEELNVEVPEHA